MRIPAPTGAALDALIDEAAGIDLMLATRERAADRAREAPPRVSAADIWRAVHLGDPASLERVRAAAAADPGTARAFAAALSREAAVVFPTLRAADTGAATERRSGDWVIALAFSERNPDRCFLTIEVPEGVAEPRFLACTLGETMAGLALPAPEDGIIQVVLERGDPVVVAVADRQSVLSLL